MGNDWQNKVDEGLIQIQYMTTNVQGDSGLSKKDSLDHQCFWVRGQIIEAFYNENFHLSRNKGTDICNVQPTVHDIWKYGLFLSNNAAYPTTVCIFSIHFIIIVNNTNECYNRFIN